HPYPGWIASRSVTAAAEMIAGMLRQERRAASGPTQIDSSASRLGSESVSAFECAMTVRMPSSRQVRMIRSAISPRFAIRILWNTRGLAAEEAMPLRFDLDQPQPVHAERRV